jgi:hypothetical protein
MRKTKAIVLAMVVMVSVLALALMPSAASAPENKTTVRPIEDFIEAQGTYWGPGYQIIWWNNDMNKVALIDYAGLINWYIGEKSGGEISSGIEFSGSVTERPLADGRTLVHVKLHVTNAIVWIFDLTGGGVVFGNSPPQILNGAEIALAKILFEVKYTTNNAPGEPLHDLTELMDIPEEGEGFVQSLLNVQAKGELHEGFGVEEGTPGHLSITMREINNAPGIWNAPRPWPNWPVGEIRIKAVGN